MNNQAFEQAKSLFFSGLKKIARRDFLGAEADLKASLLRVPGRISTLVNLSSALLQLKKLDELERALGEIFVQEPDNPEAWINLGGLRKLRGDFPSALQAYDRAIELIPNSPEAWANRGDVLHELAQREEAIKSYAECHRLAPDHPYVLGKLIHQKMLVCDWTQLDELIEQARNGLGLGKRVVMPFGFQGYSDSEAESLSCAQIYAQEFSVKANLQPESNVSPGQKIKIGYLCGEFRQHATSILMTEVFELHDTTRFDIYAFDNGWDDGSELRARQSAAFKEIVDISACSDDEACVQIRERKIDLLINLNGYFGFARDGIFARKPAPLQVNYLGFPGTIGAPWMDYLVADETVIPVQSQQFYTEKVAYLPLSYQCNDSKRKISERHFSRTEVGLPDDAFVYCCFNNNYKITPHIFSVWMHILSRVPKSVLWLIEDTPRVRANLSAACAKYRVSPDRIIFAARLPLDEHLARHQLADVFLDTLPYNAHTTASDALWAGLPVLTCSGATFPGRVASSLLKALGVPELITEDLTAYEDLAVKFSEDREHLYRIRKKLLYAIQHSGLFDSFSFTRALESLYVQMHGRRVAGLPPESLRTK